MGSVPELMKSISHGFMIQLTAQENIMQYAAGLQAHFEGCNVNTSQDDSLILVSPKRIPLLPVIQYFDEKGISVHEAKELHPTLEDVFVKVTGTPAAKLKKEKEKGA